LGDHTTSALGLSLQERGLFTLGNHTILRLGELAREGLIGKTKLPLLSVHHFKERGSFTLANHTILGLCELTQEGGLLNQVCSSFEESNPFEG